MKLRHLTMLGFLALTIGVCANTNPISLTKEEEEILTQFSDDPKGEYLGVQKAVEDAATIPETLTIHYQMDPPVNYDNLRFYVWAGGVDGVELEADGVDDFGMYITLHPKADYPSHEIFYFIIKIQNTWAGQSTDTVIDYSVFPPDENGLLEIWAIDGSGANIDIFATKEETLGDKITYAKFTDWKTIHVEGTGPIASYRVYALTPGYYNLGLSEQNTKYEDYLIISGDIHEDTNEIDIHFEYNMPPSVVYQVQITFANYPDRSKTRPADFDLLYKTDRFEQYYTYDGQLGAIYTKEKTTFRLWAPMAARVEMRLYYVGTPLYLDENGTAYNNTYRLYNMSYLEGGVWSCEVEGDLNNYYYTYYVYNNAGQNEVVDPYAKSAGVNGERGMILDFDTTDPEGWNEIPLVWDGDEVYDLAKPTDLAIYEIHIRDLTMDETWGGKSTPGTYQAFIEEGTTYTQDNITVTTGFDHIEELGVNAIQILPVFDQSNNEVNMSYNWGYNPLNYNVVEGGYSSNPYDGAVRVKEFKQLVQAYAQNDNHTRVIMDVVYNHVSSAPSSNFQKIMPNYYFRMTEDGYYKNGAGCSNEVKTEATMMSKFIVDSVIWWATEYKIKGFRFDLMGLIDTETMRKVKDALYEIDPDFVVYGEPWTSIDGYGGDEGTNGTDRYQVYSTLYQSETSPGLLAAFNDGGRNGVRGGNDQGYGTNVPYPGWGFIAQGAADSNQASHVASMLRGAASMDGGGANPYQTLNYVSCHDNYTLFDQLNYTIADLGGQTMNPPASLEPNPLNVAEASLAAHAAVAFSQGIAFIQGGEELFRSKVVDPEYESYEVVPYPDAPSYDPDPEVKLSTHEVRMFDKIISHNSYRNSDNVNAFRYDRKIAIEYQGQEVDVYNVSQKFNTLFELRKQFSEARISYSEQAGSPFQSFSAWYNTADNSSYGATMIGLYFNLGTNHNGDSYYLFFSGRDASTISWDQAGSATLIYNSASLTGTTNEGISFGDGTLSLGAKQFVVFVIKK